MGYGGREKETGTCTRKHPFLLDATSWIGLVCRSDKRKEMHTGVLNVVMEVESGRRELTRGKQPVGSGLTGDRKIDRRYARKKEGISHRDCRDDIRGTQTITNSCQEKWIRHRGNGA